MTADLRATLTAQLHSLQAQLDEHVRRQEEGGTGLSEEEFETVRKEREAAVARCRAAIADLD